MPTIKDEGSVRTSVVLEKKEPEYKPIPKAEPKDMKKEIYEDISALKEIISAGATKGNLTGPFKAIDALLAKYKKELL